MFLYRHLDVNVSASKAQSHRSACHNIIGKFARNGYLEANILGVG